MEQARADYFGENPSASNMLTTMTKAGLPYVVHEYLHEHWAPMYFARVAWEMAASDLHFVGVLPVHLNFRDMAVPAALEPVFGNVTTGSRSSTSRTSPSTSSFVVTST